MADAILLDHLAVLLHDIDMQRHLHGQPVGVVGLHELSIAYDFGQDVLAC